MNITLRPSLFLLSLPLLLLAACKNLKSPELKGIENFEIGKAGLKESTVQLQVHYYNPNNFKLKLKKAEGDAWLDGNPLGHFIVDTTIQIMPRSDFKLPVTLKLDMKHFVENMTVAFLGKTVLLKMKGTARVGKGFIYINYPLEYEGKESLSEWLK